MRYLFLLMILACGDPQLDPSITPEMCEPFFTCKIIQSCTVHCTDSLTGCPMECKDKEVCERVLQ